MHEAREGEAWNPFPPTAFADDRAHRREANRAIGWSALGLSITGGIELVIAFVSGSAGLFSDAIHNLADVSTSLVALVGFRISRRPATPAYPYGYQRAEDLAALGVALLIWASGAIAAFASIEKLLSHRGTSHLALGMLAAAVGIAGNQVVAWYKKRVGTRIQSTTLLADAKHSWLDAIASGGALLGLLGVALGFGWADGAAGLVVAGFIFNVGWEVTHDVVAHLVDGVDPGVISTAERVALSVPGVEHAHVRARWLGRTLLIEVEGYVGATVTVDAAERLGTEVERRVRDALPSCRSVIWMPHALARQPDGDA